MLCYAKRPVNCSFIESCITTHLYLHQSWDQIGGDNDRSKCDIGSDPVEQPTDPFSIFADGYESQNDSQDGSQDGNSEK